MKKQRGNEDFIKNVALKIKKIREEKGVSQANFYIDTDIHIGRIEAGRQNISIGTLKEICHYFNISLSDFFREIP